MVCVTNSPTEWASERVSDWVGGRVSWWVGGRVSEQVGCIGGFTYKKYPSNTIDSTTESYINTTEWSNGTEW